MEEYVVKNSLVVFRDGPCPIAYSTLASNDNKLKQSSGQMLVLLKILPFLLDVIKGSAYFSFILELLEIVQILFSPVICLESIDKMKVLSNSILSILMTFSQITTLHLNNITCFMFHPRLNCWDQCSVTCA